MAAPVVLIGDQAVIAQGPVSWSVRPGVEPAIATIPVHPDALSSLLGTAPYSVTLSIDGETWEQLSVLGNAPMPDPYTAAVIVADRRYWWRWRHVQLAVNIPRRVGTQRRGSPTDYNALIPAVGVAEYKRYSLMPSGSAWDAKALVAQVIYMADGTGASIVTGLDSPTIKVENLDIDADGAAAVAQVLSYLKLAQVVILPSGLIEVRPISDGSEIPLLAELGHEIVGGGHIQFMDRSQTRPEYIDVLFTPEIELRLDALDVGGEGSTDINRCTMQNVIPVTDFTLRLPDREEAVPGEDRVRTVEGDTVATGTWITISEALAAWGAKGMAPNSSVLAAGLTSDVLREAGCPLFGASLWSALGVAGSVDLDGAAAAQWSGRLSALMQSYRQVYRMPREWLDCVRAIRPYLCATIDVRSGTRAPARVFSDHALIYSDLAYMHSSDPDVFPFGTNVKGYPGLDADPTPFLIPSPFDVQVLDEDQGIIRLAPRLDPYGSIRAIAPSLIEDGPKRALRSSKRATPLVIGEMTPSGTRARLARDSKAAIYLTVVPAIGLYRIRVQAASLVQGAPAALAESLASARGPGRQVRVPPSVETARVAWAMSNKEDIGVAIRGGTVAGARDAALQNLRSRCINDAPQAAIGDSAASLPAIARAVALAIYSAGIDAPAGSMTTGLSSSIVPTGRISDVTHTVTQEGARTTRVSLMGELPIQDALAYMPMDVQRIILRTVK